MNTTKTLADLGYDWSSFTPPVIAETKPDLTLTFPATCPTCGKTYQPVPGLWNKLVKEQSEAVSSESPPAVPDILADLPLHHVQVNDPQDVVRYMHETADQITTLTRERDEAEKDKKQLFSQCIEQQNITKSERSRAEAAEKKLAEVEKSLRFEKESFMRQSQDMDRLRGQLSKLQWTPTATRLPTKEDANERGFVWIRTETGFYNTVHFNTAREVSVLWMPIPPLPTPPEEKEDAFETHWKAASDGNFWLNQTYKNVAREAFLAGQQSKQ